ncbi:response regulator transcription factor [Comamonas sp. SCN 65-56]|uniref:response regulator transcription factor n=1 Tax=Comamonas sp. SCN 65-56 TaxID=1660095 RepID=UPI000A6769D0|nr:response regulator transcription factor [Comamonas sp. SCN 65-56]
MSSTHPDTFAPVDKPPALQSSAHGPCAILLVDDHELVRLGFRTLLTEQPRAAGQPLLTIHEADTLAHALTLYQAHAADIAVVVLDLTLRDSHGLDTLIAMRQACPDATVVVLSGTAGPAVARDVLALGAAAYFPKTGDLSRMLEFVRTCALQGAQVAQQMQHAPRHPPDGLTRLTSAADPMTDAGSQLTARQLQTLQWVLEGKSNREIGEITCLSEGTVKNHVSMLLLSFAVRSRAQLIAKLRG